MVPDAEESGTGAAAAENAPVGNPAAGEGGDSTPEATEPEAATESSEVVGEETPAKEADTPKEEADSEAVKATKEALEKVDFRVKELRAIGRTSGSISVKLIEVPGVKAALTGRGWFVDRSADPLNYHVKFTK